LAIHESAVLAFQSIQVATKALNFRLIDCFGLKS
jgi:hypothetical protein